MNRSLRMPVALAIPAFRAAHRLDLADHADERVVVRLGPLGLPFPNPGYLPFHDLHHIALDVPPRFWGEVEVSAFELRSGCPTWLIWFLCVSALVLGGLVAPRRVWRAWKRYAGCRNVYRGYAYADLLALSLGELRGMLRLDGAGGEV
jgi:hypothetical protein